MNGYLLRYVPGTPPYHRRQLRVIQDRVSHRLHLFTFLFTRVLIADFEVHGEVEAQIRRCERQISETAVWDLAFMQYLILPCVVILVLCSAFYGLLDVPWLLLGAARPSSWPMDSLGNVVFGWIVAAAIVPFLPSNLMRSVRERKLADLIVLGVIVLVLVILAFASAGSLALASLRLLFGTAAPSRLPAYVWPGLAAGLVLILSPAVAGDEEVRRRFRQAWFALAMLAYAGIVLQIVAPARAGRTPPTSTVNLLACLTGTLVPVVVSAPALTLAILIGRALDWRRLLRHPDAPFRRPTPDAALQARK